MTEWVQQIRDAVDSLAEALAELRDDEGAADYDAELNAIEAGIDAVSTALEGLGGDDETTDDSMTDDTTDDEPVA